MRNMPLSYRITVGIGWGQQELANSETGKRRENSGETVT